MADLDLLLPELRGFRQEYKEQLETIIEDVVKANTRMDQAEEGTEREGEGEDSKHRRNHWGHDLTADEIGGSTTGPGESLQT